jgi:hypothetical protein
VREVQGRARQLVAHLHRPAAVVRGADTEAEAVTQPMPEDLVLAAYGDDVPCIMQLAPEGCEEKAAFLIRIEHVEDGTNICESPERTPVCARHKDMITAGLIGFWAELRPPPPCSACLRRIKLASVEPLGG